MCPMRVKSNRGDLVGENGSGHRFPVGMHVLAVDDDTTCLGILETMLRKCQYQVTTESRAVEALRMLRENRNKYDLVISDVKMPDIGGMELLKVVGLEMDLPVIMLSAYGDTELVMEGITHGACDYLLKPVRMEELKNIWQHVIRRRKSETNNVHSHCPDLLGAKEGGPDPTSSGNEYQNENSNRKRKDHIKEEEEEDGEENGPEDDDSSRQKKPRVVWSIELHQKFVVAVSQLGLDKAVPKKILDLMNVEGLTRENVASHLQKFRLYLKKVQDNRVAPSGKNSSYIPMSALDGFRDFHSSGASGRYSSASLSSYPQGGTLGRLNSLAGLRMHGTSHSELIQPTLSQTLSSSFSGLQSAILPSNQRSNLFQGFPSSLDYKEFGSISDPTSSVGCLSKSIVNAPSNPLMALNRSGFGNQSCVEFGANGSSNDSWQSGVQLATFPSNSEPFGQIDPFSPSTSHISNNPMEGGLIGNIALKWENHGMQHYSHGMNTTSSTLHSLQNNFVNNTGTYASLAAQSHSVLGTGLRSDEEFLLEQTKSQDWHIESLDNIMNTMDKREQRPTTLLDA